MHKLSSGCDKLLHKYVHALLRMYIDIIKLLALNGFCCLFKSGVSPKKKWSELNSISCIAYLI